MRAVIVSTHLDDAVLSCWSVIDGPGDVTVVTVFTGGPEPGPLTEWDLLGGAPDSATRMEQRRAEDRAALAVAGRVPVHLGHLESQYVDGAPDVPRSALVPCLDDADVVYAPAGIAVGRDPHQDHTVVRDAVQGVRPDAILYADQPYCQFRTDVELVDPRDRSASLVELDEETRVRKAEAIRCYVGELPILESPEYFGPFATPDRLVFELFWRRQ
jgi:LmbE family N-acetylglucosaminyl deacetylase